MSEDSFALGITDAITKLDGFTFFFFANLAGAGSLRITMDLPGRPLGLILQRILLIFLRITVKLALVTHGMCRQLSLSLSLKTESNVGSVSSGRTILKSESSGFHFRSGVEPIVMLPFF